MRCWEMLAKCLTKGLCSMPSAWSPVIHIFFIKDLEQKENAKPKFWCLDFFIRWHNTSLWNYIIHSSAIQINAICSAVDPDT